MVRGEAVVALSRDLISLLISFSVMLAAALAVLPQRIAQSPPQPGLDHESITAPPGKRLDRRARPAVQPKWRASYGGGALRRQSLAERGPADRPPAAPTEPRA